MAITEFDYFCADAINVSAIFFASTDDEQADGFLKNLYLNYEADGSPKNRKKWLREKLTGKFLSMNQPPEWVGDPRWAYIENEPMVFLHQFKVENIHGNLTDRVATGDTIFIFGSKVPAYPEPGKVWHQAYRMVAQTEEGEDLYLN